MTRGELFEERDPREEMWLNLEVLTDPDQCLIVWQADLTTDEVARVNADEGEAIARAYIRQWATGPEREKLKRKVDRYRATIIDQYTNIDIHRTSLTRETAEQQRKAASGSA